LEIERPLMNLRFLLLCALASLPSPLIAEQVSEGRHVFTDFNQCAAEQHPTQAAEVVLSDDTAQDVLKAHPDLLTGECLGLAGGELTIPGGDFVRYGLAEALVRREYAAGLPADIGQAAPLLHPPINESDYQPKPGQKLRANELASLKKRRDMDVGARLLSIYGECVARADPVMSLRLVLAKPDSSDETQAFAAMNPIFSSCLVQGQTLTFSKSALRGTIAMNLYRLAKAPRVQVSPTH
jgi:hypothetical protein